jgi:hypothetical protein
MIMKNIFSFLLFLFPATILFAQKETFDITTYTAPKGWVKKKSDNAVQFSKEDASAGSYCMITLFKAIPGTEIAKENFDAAWEKVVKGMVSVTAAPIMKAGSKEDGWEAKSGYSSFDMGGTKGVALLVTSSGYEKMVNIVILTNSDAYESSMNDFLASVSFEKPFIDPVAKKISVSQPTTKAKADGFAFTTTNFDDGWTSTVQEDWVQVMKGNIRVLIHYPNKKADTYNSVLKDGSNIAWNILVAPHYSTMANFANRDVQSWESITFIEADLIDKASGKNVHVVLFKKHYTGGNGSYMEIITPDKNSFEKEFGAYHQSTSGWENLEKMANYNKFAVAASDLKGKWTNNFSGLTQYVNAYTGASAGADTHASNEVFEFTSGNTYKWSIGVASGFVGNIKFQSVKSNGNFSMLGNWQVNFSDLEGKPKKYNVYFSCIKGARILWLQDTGYGSYTGYGKSE